MLFCYTRPVETGQRLLLTICRDYYLHVFLPHGSTERKHSYIFDDDVQVLYGGIVYKSWVLDTVSFKSHLLVKNDNLAIATNLFSDTDIQVSAEGHRSLGAPLGSESL